METITLKDMIWILVTLRKTKPLSPELTEEVNTLEKKIVKILKGLQQITHSVEKH